jgi:hypothetical protein
MPEKSRIQKNKYAQNLRNDFYPSALNRELIGNENLWKW